MSFGEDAIGEAAKLVIAAGYWWLAPIVILLGAVALILYRRGTIGRLLRRITIRPQAEVDEGGILPPPSGPDFGDPDNPGGGPTGGMG